MGFEEEQHPRDDHGRFAGGGLSTWAAKTSASQVANENAEALKRDGVYTTAAATKVLGELLPGVSIRELEKAFGGSKAGAEVTSCVELGNGQVEIQGKITSKENGGTIGNFSRTVYRDDDGKLTVKHDSLFLDDAERGKGIGQSALRDTLALERANGVEKVELDTVSIGKYVWAAHGFGWDAETAQRMRSALSEYLEQAVSPPIDRSVARQIARNHSTKAWELAALVVDGKPVGKNFLMKSVLARSWHGTLNIKDGDEGWEHAKKKLGL